MTPERGKHLVYEIKQSLCLTGRQSLMCQYADFLLENMQFVFRIASVPFFQRLQDIIQRGR
jgi:hypothetical protein